MDTSSLGGSIFLPFILLHYHCGVRSCRVEVVKQEAYSEVLLNQNTANVSCHYNTINCGTAKEIFWFRYQASTYEEIKPSLRFKIKYAGTTTTTNTILTIENIQTQDSGIYICIMKFSDSSYSNSTTAGPGTTLIIRDQPDKPMTPTNTALIVLCTLLFVYCIGVFSYYSFKSQWKIWKYVQKKCNATPGRNKTFRTRSIFQSIAAEYHKRYDGKGKKQVQHNQVIEDDEIYQNTEVHPQGRREASRL